jgi:hypothetical protein
MLKILFYSAIESPSHHRPSPHFTAFAAASVSSPDPIKCVPPPPKHPALRPPLIGAPPPLLIHPHRHRVPPPAPHFRELHSGLPALHHLQKWSRRHPLSLPGSSRLASTHWSTILATLRLLHRRTPRLRHLYHCPSLFSYELSNPY